VRSARLLLLCYSCDSECCLGKRLKHSESFFLSHLPCERAARTPARHGKWGFDSNNLIHSLLYMLTCRQNETSIYTTRGGISLIATTWHPVLFPWCIMQMLKQSLFSEQDRTRTLHRLVKPIVRENKLTSRRRSWTIIMCI
jgi:hypothetical protein